jgi:hypothetical protein
MKIVKPKVSVLNKKYNFRAQCATSQEGAQEIIIQVGNGHRREPGIENECDRMHNFARYLSIIVVRKAFSAFLTIIHSLVFTRK